MISGERVNDPHLALLFVCLFFTIGLVVLLNVAASGGRKRLWIIAGTIAMLGIVAQALAPEGGIPLHSFVFDLTGGHGVNFYPLAPAISSIVTAAILSFEHPQCPRALTRAIASLLGFVVSFFGFSSWIA